MNEETLQSDVESAPIDSAQVDQADPIQESTESATGAEQTASDEQTNEAVNQDKINKVINKKHFEKMEAERRAAAAEQQLQAFQEKERLAEQARINNVPEMPDVYDDDYDAKLAQWKEATNQKAIFDANQNIYNQQQQQLQQQAQQKQQQESIERETAFKATAKTQGISEDELIMDVSTIASYGGIGQHNVNALMQDPDAPLILKHLAANPQEIAAIQQMDGYALANHVNQNIRAKAKALKPKQSSAPSPATNIRGSGAESDGGRYALIDGYDIE